MSDEEFEGTRSKRGFDFEALINNGLMLGILFIIGLFSILTGLLIWDFVGPQGNSDLIEVFDENGTLIESVSQKDVLVKLSLTQNQMKANQEAIGGALGVLQEQRLCGGNEVIKDSSNKVVVKTNEVPKGLVYSCFVREPEGGN